jgi:peptidoglycan hydrolase CwlO-like protein
MSENNTRGRKPNIVNVDTRLAAIDESINKKYVRISELEAEKDKLLAQRKAILENPDALAEAREALEREKARLAEKIAALSAYETV